jgi:hypothetical protein
MTKRSLLLVLFAICLSSAQAQFDTSYAKSRMALCADSLVQGFKTRNWDLYARYSNPALFGAFGGRYEFIVMVREMFNTVPDSAWKKYEAGKILQVVRTGKDLQGIIELNSILEWQGMRVTSTAYMVAESWNNGFTWTFFDSQGDANTARIIIPSLSTDLVIPPKNEKIEPLPSATTGKPRQ